MLGFSHSLGPYLPFAKQLAPERWLGADLGKPHLTVIGTRKSTGPCKGRTITRLIIAIAPVSLIENLSLQDCQNVWCWF